MVHHDYIFFLQNKNRQFWGVDNSGNVTINSNPYPLLFSPDGWLDTAIENIRNKKYWAIDRTVSAPFKYVEDGAKILKHIFYKNGVEDPVYLVVCEQQLVYTPAVQYGYWYKQIFRSEIDLSTFSHAGAYITAATIEDGFAKHLKANENTVYPLSLENGENVKFDGIELDVAAHYTNPAIPDVGATGPHGSANYALPISFINQEGIVPGVSFLSSTFENIPGNPANYFPDSPNYFYYTAKARLINIKGSIKADFGSSQSVRYKIQDNYNTVHFDTGSILYAGISEIPFDLNLSLPDDAKLFIWCADALGDTIDYLDSTIDIAFIYRHDATYRKFLRPQHIWNELISKASNDEYAADDCPYFAEALHADKVFTSGDGIRGLENAELKISISQFFGFFNVFDEVGIRELNQKILFDRKNILIDQANIIDLGEAANINISFDKELPFNELAIGYPDIKNENGFVNGKNEFNTTFVYSLGTTKNPRKYDKTTQVRVSCYDAENVRIENTQKTTTDNRSDNEPYAFHIQKTITVGSGGIPDHYLLDRSLNAFLTGVDQASSVFNVIFSPKRCMIRSGDYVRSVLYLSDNKILKFISADRNNAMSYVNGADIVVENADVTVGHLTDKFFAPVIMQVEVNPPVTILDDLDTNPGKIFQFTFNGDTYKGISVKNGINPKANRQQTYELWPTADTDLTKLIDYYGG